MQEVTELKPCPFCGSTNIDPKGWASTDSAGPACDDCGASAGGPKGTLQDNIEAWNRRSTTVDGEKVSARQMLAMHYRASEYPPMVHEANGLIHGRLCRREQAAVDAIDEAMAAVRIERALALSESDKEVALAQAVELAQYVEKQGKGGMREAAARFLSLPYAQDVAKRIRPTSEACP